MKNTYLALAACAALTGPAFAQVMIDDFSSLTPVFLSIAPPANGTTSANQLDLGVTTLGGDRTTTLSGTAGLLESGTLATLLIADGLDLQTSKGLNSAFTLSYAFNPPLDHSYLGLAKGIGVSLWDYQSDHPTAVTVTYTDGGGDTAFYDVNAILGGIFGPAGNGEVTSPTFFMINGDDPGAVFTGVFDLNDIVQIDFSFDPAEAGDTRLTAIGVPEPHEYGMLAGLGLLGLGAWRRFSRKS
jgi:hypothetical protein